MNQFKLQIGAFSRLCGVTVKTLRHYEKLGLLIPEKTDRYSGYRYYSIGQLLKLNTIRQLKSLGFKLDEIRALFASSSHYPNTDMLAEKVAETDQQLAALTARRNQLIAIINAQKSNEQMEKISIQSLPSCIVASYRGTIRNYDELGRLCYEVIGPEMQRLGCECPEPGYCFTREMNKEFTPVNIDIEYCEKVSEAKTDSDLIHFYELEAVETAICFKHYGPYDTFLKSYTELFAYAEQNGYQVIGSPRAVYIDGIWNQEDSSKWLTIIQLPVSKNR